MDVTEIALFVASRVSLSVPGIRSAVSPTLRLWPCTFHIFPSFPHPESMIPQRDGVYIFASSLNVELFQHHSIYIDSSRQHRIGSTI